VSTLVPISTREVLAPSAPSQVSENGECAPVCFQDWKWSLIPAMSNPHRYAATVKSSRSDGPNCSAETLYPNRTG
jgi:hypothetical protein